MTHEKAEIESICDKSRVDFHKTFGSIFLAYTTSVLKWYRYKMDRFILKYSQFVLYQK